MLKRLTFSLLPLCLLGIGGELLLRGVGYQGDPDRSVSWCREQSAVEPPFFPRQSVLHTGAHAPRFEGQPQPFGSKPEGQRRVIALGGSAVHGYGFTRPGAWPDQLEGLLAEAWEGEDVQVINAGAIAWSSQQILSLVKELLAQHEPDALLVVSGNNELLEWFDARRYLPPAELRAWMTSLTWSRRLRRLRLFRLGVEQLSDAELGYWGQTEFTDDEDLPWPERDRLTERAQRFATEAYRYHMQRILDLSAAHQVPVLLSTVAVNYEDSPGDFEGAPPVPAALSSLREEAQRLLEQGELDAADEQMRRAEALWPEAQLSFAWAQQLRRHGAADRALPWYRDAVAKDENPHRAPPYLNQLIREELGPQSSAWLDAEALVGAQVKDGIADWSVIYDYCHPTPPTHSVLAQGFADLLTEQVWPGGVAQSPPEPGAGHVDGWLGVGVSVEEGHYSRDPGSDRLRWWREAQHAAGEQPDQAEVWSELGAVVWHSFHADCDRGRAPCLQEAFRAWERATQIDPDYCPAHANTGRAWFSLGEEAASRESLTAAVACDPSDQRSAWYLRRLDHWETSSQ